jgi:hypothetical protein
MLRFGLMFALLITLSPASFSSSHTSPAENYLQKQNTYLKEAKIALDAIFAELASHHTEHGEIAKKDKFKQSTSGGGIFKTISNDSNGSAVISFNSTKGPRSLRGKIIKIIPMVDGGVTSYDSSFTISDLDSVASGPMPFNRSTLNYTISPSLLSVFSNPRTVSTSILNKKTPAQIGSRIK